MRTCVTFKSNAFNTSNPKSEFIHPENFGDDVVRWFIAKFRERQIAVDEDDPSQEDHGWYVTFRVNDLLFDLVVSYVPLNDTGRWLACIERSVGLLGSMIGRRRRGVTVEVVRLIKDILELSDDCHELSWLFFEDVRRGNLENGSTGPLARGVNVV